MAVLPASGPNERANPALSGSGRYGAKGLQFVSVLLENWRNFRRVEVATQQRVFLVGPNASGKSNFLDVFRFVRDIVSVGGGFEKAVAARGGVSKIRCLAARQYPDVGIRLGVGGDAASPEWIYELQFAQDNRQRPVIRAERVIRDGRDLFPPRPDDDDRSDPDRLSQTFLQQVNVNKPFRELADFFRSCRYLHVVPQLIREPERSGGLRIENDPYGGDFLEQIAKTPEKTRNARLRRIEGALRVAVPQLRELALRRDTRGTPHLEGKYEHWRAQGARQAEDQFSDGTLRLIGLLWAALDGAGPLLLEEPELSLHPGVVRFLPQMFARIQRKTGRQVMISTHSSDLLADEGLGLDETLLLVPGTEGTDVRSAASNPQIKALLEKGLSLAEAVVPHTQPQRVDQLTLFDG